MPTPGWQPIVLPKLTPADFPYVLDFGAITDWPSYWFEGERLPPDTSMGSFLSWATAAQAPEHDPASGAIGFDRTTGGAPRNNIWSRRVVANDIPAEWFPGDTVELSMVMKWRFHVTPSTSYDFESVFGLGTYQSDGSSFAAQLAIASEFSRSSSPDRFFTRVRNAGLGSAIYNSETLPVEDQWMYAAASYTDADGGGSSSLLNATFAMQGDSMNTLTDSARTDGVFNTPRAAGANNTSDWFLFAAFPQTIELAYLAFDLSATDLTEQAAQITARGWS